MNKQSIWTNVVQKNICNKLNNDITVEVLIIGGGITGISTAYHLRNSGLKTCLVEKNTIGSGVTCKTTGKLTYLQENIYTKLQKFHGIEKTKLYLDSQKDAIEIVKNIITNNNIDCDLEKSRSYIFTNYNVNKIDKEYNLLKKFNIPIKESIVLPINLKILKSCYVDDTYVFHPLKYLFSLKDICLNNNVLMYENTKIVDIKKENDYFLCKTENNIIKTKFVVCASHYPYFLFPFVTPLKSYIEKSYIKAFKVPKNEKFSSINVDDLTISTRYHTENNINYKLYLSNSHNTCIKDNYKDNFDKILNDKMNKPEFLWSNHDIMTNDLLPFIGALNKEKTFLIGTGYNAWGMTNGSLAGKILADIILKRESKYITLFDPLRKINLGKIINFPIILGSNIFSFVKSKIIKNKSWYPSYVRFEKRNGKNVAIYVDENRNEHIVINKCPHLKCGLIFNEIEKTWDCPCHGSRFDIDGNSIEGPSNYDIKFKN